MKKLILSLMLIIGFTLIGCSMDGDSDNSSNPFIGTWWCPLESNPKLPGMELIFDNSKNITIVDHYFDWVGVGKYTYTDKTITFTDVVLTFGDDGRTWESTDWTMGYQLYEEYQYIYFNIIDEPYWVAPGEYHKR